MGTAFQLLDLLDKIQLRPIVVMCVEQSQYEILAFNRGKLYEGRNRYGQPISPQYQSGEYAEAKQDHNPKPGLGVPDLYVTGEFYNGMFMVVNASQYSFTIESKDEKATKLEVKYKDIFGIAPEDNGYLANEILKPKIVKEMVKQLGL